MVGAADAMKVVRCACGQEYRGTADVIVPLVQRHGRDVHNMPSTPEQVLAMAVDDDSADGVDSADGADRPE